MLFEMVGQGLSLAYLKNHSTFCYSLRRWRRIRVKVKNQTLITFKER